ncbi:MAG TPA: polysaccharide biosynthesis/export family protein [Fimbriimonadaceae bacterium]|nr:polysaccharide biosynthesis/export family protein [Fimbriimonadaceae bacterium]
MKRALAVFAALFVVATAFGQDPTYRLKPEDVLRIQVYNEQQINIEVPVGVDGNISAPFVGILRAQGKTTSELEADLVAEYIKKLRLRDPRVSVVIVRYRPVKASVNGMVNRPGVYDIRPGDTLLTLLSYAQGVVFERADLRPDLRRTTLRRSGSPELIPVDLYAMLKKGDTSQNYAIQDGDELIIPEDTRNRVLVLGSVQVPGSYPYTEPLTVMDAIALARGEVRSRSKFSEVLVIRERAGMPGNYIRMRSDIVRFVRKGDAAQNILLQAGDIVYVPETNTPDLDRIGTIVNTLFFVDRFARDNFLFGFGR